MIEKEDFKVLFETWQWVLNVQTEGLSQEDLLFQPQPGGNCILWVLGHMLVSMKDLVVQIGGPEPQGYDIYQRFERTSDPVHEDEPGLPDLAKVRQDFAALSALAIQALDDQTDSYFREPGWNGTKGATIQFFAFHMSYHAGQLEILRNLTGKTDKVI